MYLWKAIVEKIQTFVYIINICIGISVRMQFLSIGTACSQFELQFYTPAIL